MANKTNPLSRKKFLSWGLGLSSLLTLPVFLRSPNKKKESKTVKMLTEDGRLVTIDVNAIPSKKKKIDPEDIHTWITTKKSTL